MNPWETDILTVAKNKNSIEVFFVKSLMLYSYKLFWVQLLFLLWTDHILHSNTVSDISVKDLFSLTSICGMGSLYTRKLKW